MKRLFFISVLLASACTLIDPDAQDNTPKIADRNLQRLARTFAELPMEYEHLQEVFDAVEASSGQGYDEEYTMECLLSDPGSGVGAHKTKNGTRAYSSYANPLRNLIREYYDSHPATKSSAEEMLEQLASSGYQVYWPYSENWDGKSFPIITFDPGYGAESNYGYAISFLNDGTRVIDSVYVDERVARQRPVWVLNNNSDSGFSPIDLFSGSLPARSVSPANSQGRSRTLRMKSFKMLRHYDSWFRGASEFNILCGSADGFNASTEAELKLFHPSVTNFVIVVKRKYLNIELPLDVILVTDFCQQLDRLAFLVTEDDGGTRTSWKCQATVKIQSKSYGFDLDLPYNEKDDIVWRGQLSRQFFEEEDIVSERFGDVMCSFELD